MEKENIIEEIKKSEEYKKIKECFDTLLNFTGDLLLNREDHNKVNNAFTVIDSLLSIAVENKIRDELLKKEDKKSQEY